MRAVPSRWSDLRWADFVRRGLHGLVLYGLLPIGVAVAAAAAAAAWSTPRWRAAGLPYLMGHAKNVELSAVAAGLVVGALVPWWARARPGRVVAALVAAIGFALVATHADLRTVVGPSARKMLLLVAILAGAAGARSRPKPTDGRPERRGWPAVFAAGALVAALALATFVGTTPAMPVDVFHLGEVVDSARDLLAGGRPFETWLWPHGAHDSGLAAAWAWATGKLGTSPVALGRATCAALGVVAAYLLARALLAARGPALAIAGTLAALPVALAAPAARHEAGELLHQLGLLVFAALGLAALVGSGRARELVAGACFGLGYVFRIETGLFAAFAASAAIAWRDGLGPGRLVERLRATATSLAALTLGGVASLVAMRLVLGWPGLAWFEHSLLEMPRYHTDAVGLAFPWPWADGPVDRVHSRIVLAGILLTLLLAVQAVRAALARAAGERGDERRGAGLVFLAVFALLATRSALSRSDPSHALQWGGLPLLGAVLLATAALRDRLGGRSWAAVGVAVTLLASLDFGTLRLATPWLRPPAELAGELADRRALVAEHLAPNPPVGPCADTTLTPVEAATSSAFVADTCEAERALRAHGVASLAIAHSAPWYLVRFAMPTPTPFFALARAYTPVQQLVLVDDLRRAAPDALLRARGHLALESYDVPDALRVPVVDAYLRARAGDAPVVATPIGDLVLWNEPAPPAMAAGSAAAGPAVALHVDYAVHAPDAELLIVRGWAVEQPAARPLAGLEPAPGARVDYGLTRPEVAARFGSEALRSGFELVMPLPAARWHAEPPRALTVLARGSAGGLTPLTLDLAAARTLPPLARPEWEGAAAAMTRARTLGEADRVAALARFGAGLASGTGAPSASPTPP